MATTTVALVAGSRDDLALLERVGDVLERLGVGHTTDLVPAHLDPSRLAAFAEGLAEAGARVVVAVAGEPLHLPALVAAHTVLPVVGLPAPGVAAGEGVRTTAAAPAATPVATVAAGAVEAAANLAARVVALDDPALAERLTARAREQAEDATVHRSWTGDEAGAVGFGFRPR
jgi:5-(carboxyamino)imidazole ribonucleotide mutase